MICELAEKFTQHLQYVSFLPTSPVKSVFTCIRRDMQTITYIFVYTRLTNVSSLVRSVIATHGAGLAVTFLFYCCCVASVAKENNIEM
jgi:hypothetical protein